MSRQEANEYIIRYWEQTGRDFDERAKKLEELVPHISDKSDAEFMHFEAKALREQAARFRERAEKHRDPILDKSGGSVPGAFCTE